MKYKNLMLIPLLAMSMTTYANDGARVKKANGKVVKVKVDNSTELINLERKIIKDNLFISGKLNASKSVATVFPYYEDSNFEIFLKSNFVTMIKLEANEDVLYIASGNSEAFLIDQVRGGRDGAIYVYIKPLAEDLKTNLVITTDKRVYHFTLNVNNDTYNNKISFEYPLDNEIVSYKNAVALDKEKANEEKTEEESNSIKYFGRLNLNYRISNIRESFAPDIVYNDGVKTYIQLKKGLTELPVFYNLNLGNEENVNQKVRKVDGLDVIIIDSVITQGRLRLGNKFIDFTMTNEN